MAIPLSQQLCCESLTEMNLPRRSAPQSPWPLEMLGEDCRTDLTDSMVYQHCCPTQEYVVILPGTSPLTALTLELALSCPIPTSKEQA